MSRMLRHMSYFAMIILVVLIAFGIARESIRFPGESAILSLFKCILNIKSRFIDI